MSTPETNKAWREFIVEGRAISTLRPVMERIETERDDLRAEVERLKDEEARLDCRLFNSGYLLGHHDTVEGQYTDIHRDDFETHHSEEVSEIAAWPEELL